MNARETASRTSETSMHAARERSRSPGASVAFCLLASVAAILLRFLLFESCLLRRTCVPNHDMSQGVAFFATNCHSLRLTGDIAWWNPISREGYAQYFQSFLSPLAPTPHHITFIIWAFGLRLLAWLNVGTPSEYLQYIVFNYILLPFLTYWALGEFARRLFRHRAAVLLVIVVYALSSIGLWNAAWFYFQESFTLFFLLGCFIRAMQRPGRAEIGLLAAAALVQLSSLNYWSIYNALFVLLFCGTYIAFHPREAPRLVVESFRLIQHDRSARIAISLAAVTAVMWMGLIASTAHEQGHSYLRTNIAEPAASRIKSIRTFTAELFNPGIEIALENYPVKSIFGGEPPIHNARYLGVTLLPLLALVPFLRWQRETAWLMMLAFELFVVCLAPPFLAGPVSKVPYLNHIQHLFYFYTAHWQLLVVLLAARGLDASLGSMDSKLHARLAYVARALIALGAVLAVAAWMLGDHLPGIRRHPYYYVRMFLLGIASTLVAYELLVARTQREKGAWGLLLISTLAVDLSLYFRHCSRLDKSFTLGLWGVPDPLPPEYRQRLLEPMPMPDPALGMGAGLDRAIPITNSFWPENTYLIPTTQRELSSHPEARGDLLLNRQLDFYPRARPPPNPLVLLHDEDVVDPHFETRWVSWRYNSFSFWVTNSHEGWIFLRRTFDPLWQFTVDGKPAPARAANYVGTALHVHPGSHEINGSYRPIGRTLYWPASALLVMTLSLLLFPAVANSFNRVQGLRA